MRWLQYSMLVALVACGGCVVHDGKSDSEPVYWPTFMLREHTVQPQGGKVQIRKLSNLPVPVESSVVVDPEPAGKCDCE